MVKLVKFTLKGRFLKIKGLEGRRAQGVHPGKRRRGTGDLTHPTPRCHLSWDNRKSPYRNKSWTLYLRSLWWCGVRNSGSSLPRDREVPPLFLIFLPRTFRGEEQNAVEDGQRRTSKPPSSHSSLIFGKKGVCYLLCWSQAWVWLGLDETVRVFWPSGVTVRAPTTLRIVYKSENSFSRLLF